MGAKTLVTQDAALFMTRMSRRADALPAWSSVLVVVAHPDDEVVWSRVVVVNESYAEHAASSGLPLITPALKPEKAVA